MPSLTPRNIARIIFTFAHLPLSAGLAAGCAVDQRDLDLGIDADTRGSGGGGHAADANGPRATGGTSIVAADGDTLEAAREAGDDSATETGADAHFDDGAVDSGATACASGGRRCDGRNPQVCSSDAAWVSASDAACPFLCKDGICTGECTPATRRCSGPGSKTPQKCTDGGEWVDDGSPCLSLCTEGACTGSCSPGSTQCSPSNTPQFCNTSGLWESATACGGSMPACLGGQCVACTVGDKRCRDGKTPQTCSNANQWIDATACSGDLPVCLQGACACSDAQPARCKSDSTPEVCSSGTWVSLSACTGSIPYCLDGKCKPCKAPSSRCGTNGVEQCSNGDWVLDKTCTLGCQNGRCLTPPEVSGVVGCGGETTCTVAQGCCNLFATYPVSYPAACGACTPEKPQSTVYSKCDGPSDCGAGEVCCLAAGSYVTPHSSSYCRASQCQSQPGVTMWTVCNPAAPACASGETCAPSSLAGNILSVCGK
jgi:hypothetical protein